MSTDPFQALRRQFCRTGAKLNYSIFRTVAWRVPSTRCSKSTGAFAPAAPVPTEGVYQIFLHLRSHLTRIFCLFDSPHPSLLAPVYITPYTRDRSYYTCFCHICLPFELSFKLERRYGASDKSIFSSGKSSPKTEKLTVNLP